MFVLLLLIVPAVFSMAILLSPSNRSRQIAFTGAVVELVWAINDYIDFIQGYTAKLSFQAPWIPGLGINFNLEIDGISLILVLLTGLLYPFIVGVTFRDNIKNPKAFYSLMLLMQLGLMGVFIARDAFLFYVFYELTLMPAYFICAIWGGERSIPITLKFFIYTLAGSLFMLVAIIYLYFKTPGDHTFDITAFYNLQLTQLEQSWIFWAFFLAFAVKIPIFPFHTWQPDTYTVSPAAGTILLAGIMLKMGVYGLIRLVIPIVPGAVAEWGNMAIILCVIGIVYASLIAFRQQDLKRLVAYSSIAHVGLIGAGVLSVNASGMQGAVIQMFNHGINVTALFFMIDIIERRVGTRWMDELGGLAGSMKRFSVLFMIVLLGSIGLPLTNGFIGEFLLLMGLYAYSKWMAAFAGLSLILGAAYMLRLYRNVFFGQALNPKTQLADTRGWETWMLVSLCLIIIVIGVYPSLILNITSNSVDQIIQVFHHYNSTLTGL